MYVIAVLIIVMVGVAVALWVIKNKHLFDPYNEQVDAYVNKFIYPDPWSSRYVLTKRELEPLRYSNMLTRIDHDNQIADRFVVELIKDLKLFEAYHQEYTLKRFIGYAIAHLLEFKLTPKTAYPEIHHLKMLELTPPCRTDDLCDLVMDSIKQPTRKLLGTLVEKKTYGLYELKGNRYESVVVNIVLKLIRLTLELENEKQNV